MVKSFTYPDGTQTFTEPKDGETFQLFDKNRVFESEWMWDGFLDVWIKRAQPGLHSNGQPVVFLSSREQTDDELLKDFERMLNDGAKVLPILEKVCECGAEKIKSSHHSSWCPKDS